MSEEKHKANHPLDVDAEILELSKSPIEHGVISEPCVVLTSDDRIVIAEFSVHQDIQDGKLTHDWGWHEFIGARLNEEKDSITFERAIAVDVITWQEINLI